MFFWLSERREKKVSTSQLYWWDTITISFNTTGIPRYVKMWVKLEQMDSLSSISLPKKLPDWARAPKKMGCLTSHWFLQLHPKKGSMWSIRSLMDSSIASVWMVSQGNARSWLQIWTNSLKEVSCADWIDLSLITCDIVRDRVSEPLALGFGLSTREHFLTAGKAADAVVMGSRIIQTIENAEPANTSGRAKAVRQFCASITQP